jgi:hypothetical protein
VLNKPISARFITAVYELVYLLSLFSLVSLFRSLSISHLVHVPTHSVSRTFFLESYGCVFYQAENVSSTNEEQMQNT